MKTYIQIIFISAAFIFFQLPIIHSQCGLVEDKTLSASSEEIPNDSCIWTITFVVCNHSRSGNSSLKYGLVADDLGLGKLDTINPLDEICDVCNITFPGETITNTYTGSCDVIFNLEWEGHSNPECQSTKVCAFGTETTAAPQPVELAEFTGTPINGKIELSWVTRSESANRYFEIQRAKDGMTFEMIGAVQGQGTSDITNYYTFIDSKALPIAYYRLKQVDYDDNFEFSDIICVKRGNIASKIIAYPTQAFDYITIRLEALDNSKSYLKIGDISGLIMDEKTFHSMNETEYLTLNIKDYPAGIYFVSLSNKVNTVSTKFVVIKN